MTARQVWISMLTDQWRNPTVAKQDDWSKSSGSKTGSDNSPVVMGQACHEEGGFRSSQNLKLVYPLKYSAKYRHTCSTADTRIKKESLNFSSQLKVDEAPDKVPHRLLSCIVSVLVLMP